MDSSLICGVALAFAPFAILFLVLKRYQKEQFGRWFFTYCVCAFFGGLFALVAAYANRPIIEAYVEYTSNVFKQFGGPATDIWSTVVSPLLLGLTIWYSGIAFGIWLVWQQHSSRRKENEPTPPDEPK